MVRVPNDFGIIPRPFPDSEHEAYWKDWKESKEHEIKSRPDNPRQASRFAQTIPDDRFRLVIWVGKDFKFGDAPGLRIEVVIVIIQPQTALL